MAFPGRSPGLLQRILQPAEGFFFGNDIFPDHSNVFLGSFNRILRTGRGLCGAGRTLQRAIIFRATLRSFQTVTISPCIGVVSEFGLAVHNRGKHQNELDFRLKAPKGPSSPRAQTGANLNPQTMCQVVSACSASFCIYNTNYKFMLDDLS